MTPYGEENGGLSARRRANLVTGLRRFLPITFLLMMYNSLLQKSMDGQLIFGTSSAAARIRNAARNQRKAGRSIRIFHPYMRR